MERTSLGSPSRNQVISLVIDVCSEPAALLFERKKLSKWCEMLFSARLLGRKRGGRHES